MDWTSEDVSTWLIENSFDRFVDKFKGIDESLLSDHLVDVSVYFRRRN